MVICIFISFITDIPLAEYIRRRRLTQAALELQNSNVKVIDVAVKSGYDTAASFARAFKALHGLTPVEAKQEGVKLKAYPKISFQNKYGDNYILLCEFLIICEK